jgi:hypothetical protein
VIRVLAWKKRNPTEQRLFLKAINHAHPERDCLNQINKQQTKKRN